MAYIVRYADHPITTWFGWASATDVEGEPAPQPAGTRQSMVVSGLEPGRTYYFAIAARDEAGNEGWFSNSPGAAAGTTGSTCSISGRVIDANNPVSSVTIFYIFYGVSRTTTTDNNGDYTISGLGAGTYTITPSKCGYTFSPPSLTVTIPPDATGQNFTATPISGPSNDLTIENVEVTQAIQTLSNAVPLVQYKPTWVRVYVKNVPGSASQVTAQLWGYNATTGEWFSESPLLPRNGPIGAGPGGGDRGRLDGTLNFRMPWSWTQGTVTISAVVNPNGTVSESNCGNNTLSRTLEFSPRGPLTVSVYLINYRGQQPTWDLAETTSAMARKVFPLVPTDLVLAQPDNNVITFTTTLNGDRAWISLLEQVKQRCSAGANQKCYGLLPAVALSPYWGMGDNPGTSAVGQGNQQQIMAHELAHTFGRRHISGCGGREPFDTETTSCTIGEYGVDIAAQRILPSTTSEIMTYRGLDNQWGQWVSPLDYQRLYEVLAPASQTSFVPHAPAAAQDYLTLSGIIGADGSIEVFPSYRRALPSGTDDQPGTGTYSLELQDAQGQGLFTRYFDPAAFIQGDEEASAAYFFQRVPFSAMVARILIKSSAVILETLERSPNPPQVQMLAPAGDQHLQGQVNIRWMAGDADGDALSYAVEYSPNGGSTWNLIGVHLTEATFTVDTALLAGTTRGKFRVLATDGINTGIAETSGLFTIADKAPSAQIVYPEDGATYPSGSSVHLAGMAYDREDGPLSGAQLMWTLNGVQAVGTGEQVTVYSLADGIHHITLTAQDSSGNVATVSISVNIAPRGYRAYLPVLLKNYAYGGQPTPTPGPIPDKFLFAVGAQAPVGQFNSPFGVAVASDGTVYVADGANHRIQRFSATGAFLETSGSPGVGEGQFWAPGGVTVAPDGSVFIADWGNARIQYFTANNTFIRSWGTSGSASVSLAPDGTLYVADSTYSRILRYSVIGVLLGTLGSYGSGDGQFNSPESVAVASNGMVYVADTRNHRIQRFSADGTFLGKWGSLGSGDGQFNEASGVAVGPDGTFYVADRWNHRIQRFSATGQFLGKWGSYGSSDAQFNKPRGVTVAPNGTVYIADVENHRIQRFSATGQFLGKWGSYGNSDGQFNHLDDVAVGSDGNIYVTDKWNNRIQRLSGIGLFLGKWGTPGFGDGQFSGPEGLGIAPDGTIYVADKGNHRIQRFTTDGTFLGKWGSYGSGDGQFNEPSDVAVGPDGTVYVADGNNHRIQHFTAGVTFLGKWGTQGSGDGQFTGPHGVAVAADGTVYVTDPGNNNRVQYFTASGQFLGKWGSQGSGDGQFNGPWGVAVAPDGTVYVTDWINFSVQRFSSTGVFLGKWGWWSHREGAFAWPVGVAVTSEGTVYVSESDTSRIQAFGPQHPTTWRGEYFANRWLAERPVLIRQDATIDFDWSYGSPGTGVPSDNFSARWQRYAWFEPGTYRFIVFTDDGVRLWVDDHLLIEAWQDPQVATFQADVTLSQGYHRVRLEYYEAGGWAGVQLNWTALQ